MNIIEQLDDIKSEEEKRLLEILYNLNDENFNKIEILVEVLAKNDKSRAVELAKKYTESYIESLKKNTLDYIADYSQIKAYLHVIDDYNLINKYQDINIDSASELLLDLNKIKL